MPSLHVGKISLSVFRATLSRYTDTAPSTLSELDTLRYDTIPAKLAKIKQDACLQKSDVERLVEWKLKHGTYRPALMGLVKSNPADVVKSTTQEAFASLTDSKDVMKAVKIMTKLRGIGPATASLLLSVFQPDTVPFFSDEVFRWTHWDEKGKTGWGRSIKYNVSEYKEIVATVEELRKRLGVAAVDVEKVAYVLGKEGVDVDAEMDEGSGDEAEDKTAGTKIEEDDKVKKTEDEKDSKVGVVEGTEYKSKGDLASLTAKKGAKRKAEDAKAPAEGTRRSARRKA